LICHERAVFAAMTGGARIVEIVVDGVPDA
jgi:hypothetical protein